jgi:hypothetical protein
MENNHDKLVKANAKLKSTHDPLVQMQKQISTMMEGRFGFMKSSATTQSANRKENLQLSCFHFLFPVLGFQFWVFNIVECSMSIFCSFKICFQPNSDVGMQEIYSVMFMSFIVSYVR